MMQKTKAKTVGEYIKQYPAPIAARLRAIRAIVRKAAPKVEESISYFMPAYKLNGPLLYFAAFKNHIGFYALPGILKVFKKELAGYTTTKGTVQFQHDEPLPLPLIRKMVLHRVQEAKAKKKPGSSRLYP